VQEFLVIDNVSKTFGPLRAVDGVSLQIARGEVFSLLGPSGCGKTTLLRMLAGFERPDSGRILLKGQDITALPPERRPLNTVFQNYALFPHLTVADNIAFGLRMAGKPKAAITAAVERMLDLVRLKDHARKRPAQLSGGQRQRVAIARALVNEPEVLLLDEPLAALDLKLRQHMLAELSVIHQQVGTTFIYVTHDQGEALSISNRIAVLNEGKVEQIDSPAALYQCPRTRFVASFIGDANFIEGTFVRKLDDRYISFRIEGIGEFITRGDGGGQPGPKGRLMVRPENLRITTDPALENNIPAIIEEVRYLGAHYRVRLNASGHRLEALPAAALHYAPGAAVHVSFDRDFSQVLKADE
jgi:spermidine/putrescine transport system ATP-binding protein